MSNNDAESVTLYFEILKTEDEFGQILKKFQRMTDEYIAEHPELASEDIARMRFTDNIYALIKKVKSFVLSRSDDPINVQRSATERYNDNHIDEVLKSADATLKKSERTMKLIEQINKQNEEKSDKFVKGVSIFAESLNRRHENSVDVSQNSIFNMNNN